MRLCLFVLGMAHARLTLAVIVVIVILLVGVKSLEGKYVLP